MICNPESWLVIEDIIKELTELEKEYRDEAKNSNTEIDKSFNEGAAYAFHLIMEKMMTEILTSKEVFSES